MDQARPISAQSSAAALGNAPAVPDYELLRRIDAGAYGEVWLVRNNATGVLRAAKIVRRHTFKDERPFQREFEGIQKFERISREHPTQLALFHVGRNEAEGYFYYVMELADDLGERSSGVLEPRSGPNNQHSTTPLLHDPASYVPHTLRADLENGRLPAKRVLEIGLALAEALGHLHQHGLVHRDVKPSNVIFVNGRPKLADIGLVTDASDQSSIVGTEGYLPPEGPGTPQADIFALGKVLYEASTGMDRRRFPDLPADLKTSPEAASVLEMNQVVLRACAADYRTRYQKADEMRLDLQRLKASKSLVSARRMERRWRNVRRAAAWLASAAAAVSIVFLLGLEIRGSGGSQPTHRDRNEPVHSLYSEGRSYLDRFEGASDLGIAAAFFTRCTNAEPTFAPAYGCLAYVYSFSTADGWNNPPLWRDLPKAREYALESLRLQDVAEAHLALGWYDALGEWRWEDAKGEYKKALALQPSSALCHLSHAEFLRVIGKVDEALKELTNATSIQPHPKMLLLRLPAYLVDARRYEAALAAIKKDRAELPIALTVFSERSALCALGRCDKLVEMERAFRKSNGEPDDQVERFCKGLTQAMDKDGLKAYWHANKTNVTYLTGYDRACCYAQLGDTNEALRILERGRDLKDRALTFHVMTDWRLDPLRSQPRFQDVLKSMHLQDLQ
jgi:serine/threonine protein kinase